MSKSLTRMFTAYLLIVLFLVTWAVYYFKTDSCYKKVDIPNVGKIEFSIKKTIWNLFILNGGSTVKQINWEAPDGSIIKYEFGDDHGGWGGIGISVIGNNEALSFGDNYYEVVLDFNNEVLYGDEWMRTVKGANVSGTFRGTAIPARLKALPKKLIAPPGISIIDGLVSFLPLVFSLGLLPIMGGFVFFLIAIPISIIKKKKSIATASVPPTE